MNHLPESGAVSEDLASVFSEINRHYLADETETIRELLDTARLDMETNEKIRTTAAGLVRSLRLRNRDAGGLKAFLQEYDLSSHEGIVLMCLAESLLRIPDNETIDELIADKLASGNWFEHLGENRSLFVNASTWALMLTGRIIKPDRATVNDPAAFIKGLIARMEEPVVRSALKSAMHIMGHQFVMGEDITAAIDRSRMKANQCYRYSFDMLGEAALSEQDADRYQQAYLEAIRAIGGSIDYEGSILERPGISIKLSALCPRFEYLQKQRAISELARRLLFLARSACDRNIALTMDAEESERLELTLQIFEDVYRDTSLAGWHGLGIAIQSYQKRAMQVLHWLEMLADDCKKIIPLRLVKGAYWDAEIKQAQELGLGDYPVFTRKCNADVSYLACARYILDRCPHIYPQFATHNAHTLAFVYHTAGDRQYEYQRLHGMGEELYADVVDSNKLNVPCRVYAPVGKYDDLLPYLVRRLLENGANTSFVNQTAHENTPLEEIIADPVATVTDLGEQVSHPKIPVPARMYAEERRNSAGINFADDNELAPLLTAVKEAEGHEWIAHPLVSGKSCRGDRTRIHNPAHLDISIGRVDFADEEAIAKSIEAAVKARPEWQDTSADYRAGLLEQTADLYEQNRGDLIARCVREAGKTIPDSVAELREAVDLLRYYAACCRKEFSAPVNLPGPAGESNQLWLRGHGVFLCISPWNFPIAIFTGQIAAALAAGNTVIAKPAEQASLTAFSAAQLFYAAGVPADVLGFVPARGDVTGDCAVTDNRISGVAFTGSDQTARSINRCLARRHAPLPVLIAETGGLNAMIADSTALPDQLVPDIVRSAFNCAGQRCSALRVLYLQTDIADEVLGLLAGYLDEMIVGDPMELNTDIGPLIDQDARASIEDHIIMFSRSNKLVYQWPGKKPANGIFAAPVIIEIRDINQLEREVFGPVLHVIRFKADELSAVIDDINGTGYGLTLGIHSRIESRVDEIRRQVNVGNVYVNRDMIGAVVGVQPFGGMGLSGTGPKAGGPHYLKRFATEQTFTVNTTAVGGNATLLSMNQ